MLEQLPVEHEVLSGGGRRVERQAMKSANMPTITAEDMERRVESPLFAPAPVESKDIGLQVSGAELAQLKEQLTQTDLIKLISQKSQAEIPQAVKQCQTVPKDENSQGSQTQPSVGDRAGQTTLSGNEVEIL